MQITALPLFAFDEADEFYWDAAVGRYRYRAGASKGQFAPRTAVLALTRANLAARSQELVQLGDSLSSGAINLATFQQEAAKLVKRIHLQSAILGKGGIDKMTNLDYLQVARTLKVQYKDGKDPETGRRFGLKHLAQDILNGTVSPAQLRQRLNLYAQAGSISYWQAYRTAEKAAGRVYAYRKLGEAEHCPDCEAYAKMVPQPIDQIVLPTQQCQCRAACKCSIVPITLAEAIKRGATVPDTSDQQEFYEGLAAVLSGTFYEFAAKKKAASSKKRNCTPGKSHFCRRPGGTGTCLPMSKKCKQKMEDDGSIAVDNYVKEKAKLLQPADNLNQQTGDRLPENHKVKRPQPADNLNQQTGDRLPENHIIAGNSRYSPDSFDRALDAIDTEGAPERVAMFREFARKQEIQVIVLDDAVSIATQRSLIRQQLKNTEFTAFYDNDEEAFRVQTEDFSCAGYTSPAARHIVLVTDSRLEPETPHAVRSEDLRAGIGSVLDRAEAEKGEVYRTLSGPFTGRDQWDAKRTTTYLHEMGHQVHNVVGNPRFPKNILGSLTDYGATNTEEWFAEHFAAWMLDAKGYAKIDPVGAAFIEKSFKKAAKAPKRKLPKPKQKR